MNDVLKLANAELGYLEKSKADYNLYGANCLYDKTKYAGADNITKYSYELYQAGYGHPNGQPWCETFISWLFWKCYGAETANKLLCGMLKSASTMDVKNAFVRQGKNVPLNTAKPGDIVYRSRNGGGHVGLVVGRVNGKIATIEGNSSSTDISSWNGGAVVYHVGASWEWCVRPDYSVVGYRWIRSDGKYYYQNGSGENWHGWATIKESDGSKSHRYWFDSKGVMATGSVKIDGEWHFFWPEKDLNEGMECYTDENLTLRIWSE